jgi:hypothetical protein
MVERFLGHFFLRKFCMRRGFVFKPEQLPRLLSARKSGGQSPAGIAGQAQNRIRSNPCAIVFSASLIHNQLKLI